MKTRNDLITTTLELLNAVAAGQNPAPEDVQKIDGIIDGKLQELEIREIIYLADLQNFEDVYIDPLAIILANTAAPAFGQARNPDSAFAAERTLLSLKPSTYVPGSTLEVDYF